MTIIRKNYVHKIVMNYSIDLFNHLYFMLLKICKLDPQSRRPKQKI